MSDNNIVFLTDLIEQKLRKEKEIAYYESKLKEITDKLFFLKKEQDLTSLIINIIQHEKITDDHEKIHINRYKSKLIILNYFIKPHTS